MSEVSGVSGGEDGFNGKIGVLGQRTISTIGSCSLKMSEESGEVCNAMTRSCGQSSLKSTKQEEGLNNTPPSSSSHSSSFSSATIISKSKK